MELSKLLKATIIVVMSALILLAQPSQCFSDDGALTLRRLWDEFRMACKSKFLRRFSSLSIYVLNWMIRAQQSSA